MLLLLISDITLTYLTPVFYRFGNFNKSIVKTRIQELEAEHRCGRLRVAVFIKHGVTGCDRDVTVLILDFRPIIYNFVEYWKPCGYDQGLDVVVVAVLQDGCLVPRLFD